MTSLEIYIEETDQWHGRPLYAAIVELARKEGLAGATVWRGIMGYGASHRIHSMHVLDISEDLPVVIRIIDEDAKIEAFKDEVRKMADPIEMVSWSVSRL